MKPTPMFTCRVAGLYDSDSLSSDNSLSCPEESLTRQEFKQECDINTIIDQFGIGENPIEQQKWIENIDIVDATSDYQTALNQLIEAQDQFMSLPARVRSRFDNDPAKFVDFVSDSSNVDEMVSLGLAIIRPDIDLNIGDKPALPASGSAADPAASQLPS